METKLHGVYQTMGKSNRPFGVINACTNATKPRMGISLHETDKVTNWFNMSQRVSCFLYPIGLETFICPVERFISVRALGADTNDL